MKLFTPKKAKENFKARQESDITQVNYLKGVLTDLQNRINTENDKFEEIQNKQSKLYTDEKVRLQAILRKLEVDIEARRKDRAELLLPIDTLKKDIERLHEETLVKREEVRQREEETEELVVALQNKIDNLGERELQIQTGEVSLASRKKGIDAEAEMIKESHSKLNTLIAKHNADNTMLANDLKHKLYKHKIKEENWRRYEKQSKLSLTNREKKLRDREEMLERGFKELKAKQK